MTRNESKLEALLQEEYKQKDSKYSGKYSKTALFMLPTIGETVQNNLIKKFLKNVFIDDKEYEHDYRTPLFVLFSVRNQRELDWRELTRLLDAKAEKLLDYYIGMDGQNHLVMYVFDVPDLYKKDYDLFTSGEYSKMSPKYKALHPKMVSNREGKTVESIVYGILHKTETIIDVVAREFAVKKSGSTTLPANPMDVISLKDEMKHWAEVWDLPRKAEEIYRYEKILENA